jgi:hypothetical protein
MAIEQKYTAFEKAKNYTKQYELDSIDSIVTKQEDDMLGYVSAGQFATTGSNIFTGGQILIGNLTIDGDIYANTFNVTTTSIEHFTASTRFGLDTDDTHTFTGSVYITGSVYVIGEISSSTISGIGNVTLYSQSVDNRLDLVEATASYLNTTFSTSVDSRLDIIENQTGSFAITGSNIFRGDETISGSLFISGTTEFGGDLFPKEARGATLGTLERPFRDIFLQSASINIASDIPGGRGASISNADGNVTIQAAGFQLKSGSFVPFEISETARVQIKVPTIPAGDIGAFSIVGNTSGSYQPITSAGGMVHITGNDGQVNRFNLDAFGSGSTTSFNGVISRAARGTASSPSQSKAGDVTLRISSIGWRGDTGFGGTTIVGGTATSLDFIVLEDQLDGARGSAQQFYNAPIGTRNRVLSAQIDTSGLFVSGAFTASLSEGYFWVGGSGNITTLITTSSFAKVGSNTFSGSQIITGSLLITGSTIQIGNNTLIGNTILSGSVGISGSLSVNGNINVESGSEFYLHGNKLFNYGQFSDTTTQSGSANTAYSMKFNTTDVAHEISVVSGSRLTVANTGIYNIQFSAQLDNTANTNELIDIWFAVTGSNVANSNTQLSINKAQAGNFGKTVAAWNNMLPLSASNYVEIKWSSTGNGILLSATGSASNPTRPSVPSVIATITQIA